MENVNIVFVKFNFWHHNELVGLRRVSSSLVIGSVRVTENGPVDISGFNCFYPRVADSMLCIVTY